MSRSKKKEQSILKETLAQYKKMNDVEYLQRIKNAGKKSKLQKWHEYLSIMEFGLKIKPQPSIFEHRQKIKLLNDYYAKLILFEKRKTQREKPN